MGTETLSTKVRELRRRFGWTQRELAERLGVDPVTVSRWERGMNHPGRGVVRSIDLLVAQSPAEPRLRAGAKAPRQRAGQPAQGPGREPSIAELVRLVGIDAARTALRAVALRARATGPVRFAAEPVTRLREVESALREQSDLIARARIGDTVARDALQQSSRLVDALKLAHEVLNSVGVRHALIGGIAADLYRREARATQGVDFAINASAAETLTLGDAFRKAGWSAEVRGGKTESMRLAHEDLPRVDLLAVGTPFEESAIDRAVKLSIDEQQMLIVTPEDLIVYKLIAGRARDYEAVAAIINTLDRLDTAYIVGWLEQFGFADRWIRAEQEARLLEDDS